MAVPTGMEESTDSSFVNVAQTPGTVFGGAPAAAPAPPLTGYAWNRRKGYFLLPDNVVEDPNGAKIWRHDSSSYKYVIGDDLWDDESGHVSEAGWSDKSYGYGNGKHNNNKKRDGDIPEWDGKSEHRTTYFRRIDLWAATTGVEPEDRGCRLLQKLKGEAFEKLENVDPTTLKVLNSIEKFKEHIVEVYEPIEDYRIGKIMDHFLDDFQRKNDQEIIDYNLAWQRELFKVTKVAGELQGKWMAHLYLKKMRLSTLQKSQVLTGALGNYTVEALSKAALHTYPSMRDPYRDGQDRRDRGRSSYPTHKTTIRTKAYRKPFGGKGRKPWRTNEAHIDEDDDEENPDDEEWDEDWPEDYDGDEEDPDEEEEGDEVPYELEEACNEADAWFTRAKKQRAEVEKARGFFKKGVSGEDRDKGTNPLKSKLPCSKCGGLGHWHKDPGCPMSDKPFPPKQGKGGGKRKGGKRKKKKKKMDYSSYVCSMCYVTTVNGLDLPHVAYADTACARSVTGQENADSIVAHCKQHNWPFELVEDREPFRFGPGKRIWSKEALLIAVVWGQVTIVIRFSIVPPTVPFLVSKFVFKRLGSVLDLDTN